jgi:hypothetical protein
MTYRNRMDETWNLFDDPDSEAGTTGRAMPVVPCKTDGAFHS